MDFDTIITFIQILSKTKIDENDILLLSSAINNNNININISLRDNLKIVQEDDVPLDDLKIYIQKYLPAQQEYLNVPVYLLMLQDKELWHMLLLAYKNRLLHENSLFEIVELLLIYLSFNDLSDYGEIANFLNSLLSVRKPSNYKLFQESPLINSFIIINYNCLSNDLSKIVSKDLSKDFYNRLIILKLFSFGYANFDFAKNNEVSFDGLFNIVDPLLKKKSYGHLRLIINSKTTTPEQALRIKELVDKHLEENPCHCLDDQIRQEKLVKDLNNCLRCIDSKIEISTNKSLSLK